MAASVLEKTSGMKVGKAWDDPPLEEALPRVRSGRLNLGLRLINQARGDNELRALRVAQLATAALSHTDALARLAEDDPDAMLWFGAALIEQAWAIRGGSYARYVGADRFTRFWEVLETAAAPLRRAAEALPEDPVPWDNLQWHGIGMQAGRKRLDDLWKELTARDPRLYSGHRGRAQVLCAKWYGSDEEVLAFARSTVSTAAPGDPVTAVLALAHFENAWREMNDSPRSGEDVLQSLFRRQEVVRELAEAADRWRRADSPPHPCALEAMHLFGAAFYYGGNHARAQSLLAGAGRRVPEILPWAAGSLTPGRRYAKVRRELGLV